MTSAGMLWLATVRLLKAEKGGGCCLRRLEGEGAVEFGLEWRGEVGQGRCFGQEQQNARMPVLWVYHGQH